MIKRNLLTDLRKWSQKHNRKPLVIRGARQVGKTTLVNEFAKEFDAYIKLNLERVEDAEIFETVTSARRVIEILKLTRLQGLSDIKNHRILLFIDEIQAQPKAIGMLRYFYEDTPEIYVIAAGSRLQELFKTGVSFPVGRVEYMSMRPCFFDEFLEGIGYASLSEVIRSGDVDSGLHSELNQHFQTYALIGGMPEIITEYAYSREVAVLGSLYNGLLQSYDEDLEKYATTPQQVEVLRHILRTGWSYAGQTITFNRFGRSMWGSTPIHQAFGLLEKAFLVSLDYPAITVKAPIQISTLKSPKLIWLDTGLVNFSAGIQVEYLTNTTLADVWRGHAVEQVAGQQLWQPLDHQYAQQQAYWVRNKQGSQAEVDFVFPFAGQLIPIEIKSGHNAHLRSLHSYTAIEGAPSLAIRVWSGSMSIDDVTNQLTGKTFRLLNLPFYLIGQLDRVLSFIF